MNVLILRGFLQVNHLVKDLYKLLEATTNLKKEKKERKKPDKNK